MFSHDVYRDKSVTATQTVCEYEVHVMQQIITPDLTCILRAFL